MNTAVAVPARTRTAWNPLVLWHLLSLDAPTVATLWTLFVARAARLSLPWTSAAAMFLAVWVLYAADRLLDARSSASTLEPRHLFHRNHRRAFLAGLGAATGILIPLILSIPPAPRRLFVVLAALLLVWLLLVHAFARRRDTQLPKEITVGVFFAAAVFIPTLARAPALLPGLALPAVLFANLCSLNCLYIFAWEHPAQPAASAHTSTRLGLRILPALGLAAVLIPLGAAAFPASPARPILLATAFAAVGLLLLHRVHRTLDRTVLRASADVALLTPLLLLSLLR